MPDAWTQTGGPQQAAAPTTDNWGRKPGDPNYGIPPAAPTPTPGAATVRVNANGAPAIDPNSAAGMSNIESMQRRADAQWNGQQQGAAATQAAVGASGNWRSQQMALADQLRSGGTSAAEMQLRRSQDAAFAQQIALAQSQRGNQALAMRGAQANMGNIAAQNAGAASVLRAQEEAQRRGELANLLSGARQAELGLAGLGQQREMGYAGLEAQREQFGTQLRFNRDMMREQQQFQHRQAYDQRKYEADAANAAFYNNLIGAGVGFLGDVGSQLIGAALAPGSGGGGGLSVGGVAAGGGS